MTLKKATLFIILILLVDQISKVYIKTHFQLHESFEVFSWLKIYFVENDGMAWGTKLSDFIPYISDRTAKLSLTIFRLIAILGIGYWLLISIKKQVSKVLVLALVFIFAGAMGNIIDSVLYGVVFNDSFSQVASFMPIEGGYDKVFFGNVVDMLYLPMWQGNLPEWIPFVGGKNFIFFEPVFNIADVAISIGFALLIFFNKKAFPKTTIENA
ncbi:lipoprotein signal peptidase [Lacinutrix sp. 5H-3-7-4]|uniref:lipoprotein signal peptidase n=1 Tax=Lacinutrix sp. (strain 5H-3-7-4) TaxID=983544 RepID=UPI00020A33BB|nr:lipoprotein signal peptidase [Lacinutrix sp. 5H-3-7-4]AEH00670.1 Lipoprotein signal peptidase [Lacinutrix sp. 5H-3-7-4]